MSKYNNVNPGQYKVGGRERPNTVAEERLKATRSETLRKRKVEKRPTKQKSR